MSKNKLWSDHKDMKRITENFRRFMDTGNAEIIEEEFMGGAKAGIKKGFAKLTGAYKKAMGTIKPLDDLAATLKILGKYKDSGDISDYDMDFGLLIKNAEEHLEQLESGNWYGTDISKLKKYPTVKIYANMLRDTIQAEWPDIHPAFPKQFRRYLEQVKGYEEKGADIEELDASALAFLPGSVEAFVTAANQGLSRSGIKVDQLSSAKEATQKALKPRHQALERIRNKNFTKRERRNLDDMLQSGNESRVKLAKKVQNGSWDPGSHDGDDIMSAVVENGFSITQDIQQARRQFYRALGRSEEDIEQVLRPGAGR